MSLNVVGISAHFHDSACCLLQDGRLVAAAQEERFSRIKHDPRLPGAAFRYCLDAVGLTIADIDCIAYYENPVKKLDRQLWTGLPQVPPASPYALFRLDAMRPEREIRELLGFEGPIEYFDHHQSHAASGYYYSGFPEAAILTVDAVGEWTTTSYGGAVGSRLELFEEVRFPDSLGLLYSAITAYLGFEVNDAEYKVMGLAPYGEPRYVDEIRALVSVEEAGGFRLDMRYFDFLRGARMFSPELSRLFGAPPREPESALTPFAKDVARSLQVVLEEVLLAKAEYLHRRIASANLCMAGGVALNCVAVERIVKAGVFERVFVQPAATDAGGALGAAALAHVRRTGERPDARLGHVFLGPAFDADGIAALLRSSPARVHDFRGCEPDLLRATVDRLVSGKVVGWLQGRMEFGPRALGNRSILADPRDPSIRERINALVKKREAFRPFAPAVLAARAAEHFELDHPAPFMVETCRVRSPIDLPAVTHVDGSARVQTVDGEASPRFSRLLAAFEARTGCPILLNTSFNLRGEPIVCTPVDALLCFIRSDLDCLVLEDLLLDREGLPDSWLRWLRDGAMSGAGVRDDGRPGAELSALTRRLSELLASEDGTLLLARLQTLALAAQPKTAGPRPADTGGRIGVWEPRLGGGGALEFVRSKACAHEWRSWADIERIPPKARRRVVLLGESAARGYLYDPAVTPAAVLQHMLPEVEVVDLARTDLTAPELASLLDGLHALEPDAIVLFAGNNWHAVVFELTELQRLATTVRERGYAGCRRVFLDEMVVPRARALVDGLAVTARELGAEVVVVVPEFNLRDWRGEASLLVPVLPDGGNAAWMEARRRGQEALQRGDLDGASAAASAMVALDGGTSAVGPTLRAEALLAAGGPPEEARGHLEAARDALCGILVAHSPRCPREVQAVLRDKAAEHGLGLVDLPRVFERASAGSLPGRRLFLDYCHLTLEGMRIAMAEVATRLGGEPAAGAPAVHPADEGAAHFLAAIHNAHYGQGEEVVRHHCARALELDPGGADLMLAFVDSQLRPAERWICASFEILSRSAAVRRYLAAADPRVMAKLADFALVEAMVDALETARVPTREHAAALLREDDAAGRAVDLLAAPGVRRRSASGAATRWAPSAPTCRRSIPRRRSSWPAPTPGP